MPQKIRELKSLRRRHGFVERSGKGSHTVWRHPERSDISIALSGNSGADAKPYQEKEVQTAINKLGGTK
jgi:predicted RNA binding protein YcfA (HicA-like mRNA interferase family)